MTAILPLNDYRIPKERHPVVLITASGERIVGDLFVKASARKRYRREDVPEVMNAAEPFVPIAAGGEELFLVAKERVSEVEYEVADEPDAEPLGAAMPIELLLTRGVRRRGTVFFDPLDGRSRLLDFLNRVGERFVALHVPGGMLLVNRAMIERIQPLD